MKPILADLHNHSNFCDGRDTPEQMAEAAFKMGLPTQVFPDIVMRSSIYPVRCLMSLGIWQRYTHCKKNMPAE